MPAQEIVWSRDGVVVDKQTAVLQTSATTVAGGNGAGSALNQLVNPDRLFVDAYGNMYIPDYGNHRIVKWAAGATEGVVVAGFGGMGSGPSQFNLPTSVFVDLQGNLYVADQQNDRVQKWAPGATSGVTVAGAGGDLLSPTDIFIDPKGNLYASSQDGNCVMKYVPGATMGVVVAGVRNVAGTSLSNLYAPSGIFVDGSENVYVCDTYNNRVVKWAPGASAGVLVAGSGYQYYSAADLWYPTDVFVDCAGNIYIADNVNNRIQKWAPGATAGVTILGTTYPGSGPNNLSHSIGLFMDGNYTIYVSDFDNNRVQKYGLDIARSYTATVEGSYTATVKTGCGSITSNTVVIGKTGASSIQIKASSGTVCNGDSVVYTADVANGGTNPVFQWKKNGVDVGMNSNTYVENNPVNGDAISCDLTASGNCLLTPFATSNTIALSVYPAIEGFLPEDTAICVYNKILLRSSSPFKSYNWSDGSKGASITADRVGWYWLKGTDDRGCIDIDSVLITIRDCPLQGVYIPEAFSPNGDGRNDRFHPIIYGSVTNYQFSVFDRQGQLVFTSNKPNAGWDGRVAGHSALSNVFAWVCRYQLDGQPLQVQKGTVVLIR
ncbi:MAG: gliding motility-associated C-terminal domain-containing protein [Bacteroidetes bacterium]|nr:gliding motility-associated C-terminal domain-containing protein [Bacteroidota bacterium]